MPSLNQSYAWAIATCGAENVGYSMTYRNQQTVNGVTYYDCSSFIWYALLAGGFDCVSANGGDSYPFVTGTMRRVLTALGFVEVSRTGTILPGDIGVHNRGSAGGHTEMYYTGGNGTGRTMGAHSSGYPLADQVSINSGNTAGTFWEAIYRFGGGVSYSWHNKNYGGYTRESTEAQENVLKMMEILMPLGWTVNAIAALAGNQYAESGFNPWRWESDTVDTARGYGLFQYTPATKYINSNIAAGYAGFAPNYPVGSGGPNDGTAQLLFMHNNVDGGYIPTNTYNLTMAEFRASNADPGYLARAWLYNYERPQDPGATESERAAQATWWYNWILNHGYVPVSAPSNILLFKRHILNRKRAKK